ncbi:MAG: septum formation protein Maf [Bacteroidetes bacterium]|nr:septum formation protein Maf [Bacteroidota bacterium]
MVPKQLNKYKIILGSQSPRRRMLLEGLGLTFEVRPVDADENHPSGLVQKEIAVYLSELKANAFDMEKLKKNCLLITADTIVWKDNTMLAKPKDIDDARRMLRTLSGAMHEVVTAVTLKTKEKIRTFSVTTKVWFKDLSESEINYYVERFKPFDKAGAYGAQDWIGYIAISRIEGDYFNVVGLPVNQLWIELEEFIQ